MLFSLELELVELWHFKLSLYQEDFLYVLCDAQYKNVIGKPCNGIVRSVPRLIDQTHNSMQPSNNVSLIPLSLSASDFVMLPIKAQPRVVLVADAIMEIMGIIAVRRIMPRPNGYCTVLQRNGRSRRCHYWCVEFPLKYYFRFDAYP